MCGVGNEPDNIEAHENNMTAAKKNPYTFSVYSYGTLVENIYGMSSSPALDGSALSGQAPTKEIAFSRVRLAADKIKWMGGITVMVWRHGRMVNLPLGFSLALPQSRLA